jgi:hypothetical protein
MKGSLLKVGNHSQEVPGVLAAVLRASHRPAIRVLQGLSGQQLHIEVLDGGQRPLTSAERSRLHAWGLAACRWRTGLLRTADGIVAASTSLVWLPARLSYEACRALDAGTEPAGVILGRLGMRRADRQAVPATSLEAATGQDAAVRSAAVLTLGAWPVGLAEESVTRQFAEAIADFWRA